MNALIALAILLSALLPVMFIANHRLDNRKKEALEKLDKALAENNEALESLLKTLRNRRL